MKLDKYEEEVLEAFEAGTLISIATKEDLEKAASELNEKIMPIGAKLYEDAAKGAADGSKDDAETKPEEPLEGEVVDEKKEQ